MQQLKPIPGLETVYSVTRDGQVYGHFRKKFLKPAIEKNGYLRLRLSKNDKKFNRYVHQLVAQTHIPNPENKRFVNHKNHIKADNRVGNLEWCTHQENIRHSYKAGIHMAPRGSANGNAVLTEATVREIKKLYAKGLRKIDLVRKFNVKYPTINGVISGRNWGHIS